LQLSKSISSFREKVILNEKIPITLKSGTGSATLVDNNINYQKFRVNTTEPAIFYISDTYYPGWSAKINDVYTKLYRANYNFRAIVVPKGDLLVEFSYIPSNFRLSIVLSLVSLAGLLGLAFFNAKLNKLK